MKSPNLDHVVDGRLQLSVLDPGAAGPREVLGHLQPLRVLQDLPRQEVTVQPRVAVTDDGELRGPI